MVRRLRCTSSLDRDLSANRVQPQPAEYLRCILRARRLMQTDLCRFRALTFRLTGCTASRSSGAPRERGRDCVVAFAERRGAALSAAQRGLHGTHPSTDPFRGGRKT